MKVLVFGKTRNVARLIEDPVEDFRLAGHTVEVFPYRGTKLRKTLEPLLMSPILGVPLAAMLARRIRRFAPDLLLGFGPFHWLPPAIFEAIAAMPDRPPMAAWIGDSFTPDAAAAAKLFDVVAYTDTGLLASHRTLGCAAPGAFVPLAATRGGPPPPASPKARAKLLAFVASASAGRRALLGEIQAPVALFGPDWRDPDGLPQHQRDPRRVDGTGLVDIYRSHFGVLNIRNERNVVNGLNQRHFAPYIQATPVISDAQADLGQCFEPGTEILTYRDSAELNDIYDALRRDPARANAIGLAGQRRVLAHHTYAHRLETLAALAGVKPQRTS